MICKFSQPLINSHHDAIISSFSIPTQPEPDAPADLVDAPKVANTRIKITWNSEGIREYEALVSENLRRLRETWCNPDSPASMSVLLATTYCILSDAAQATNHSIDLGAPVKQKPRHHPAVVSSQRKLLTAHKALRQLSSTPNPDPEAVLSAKKTLSEARSNHRHVIRQEQMFDEINRDKHLNSILSRNSSSLFKNIRKSKSENNGDINKLHVNEREYSGEIVPDGFFDSLSSLKAPDMASIHSTQEFQNTLLDYENILKICRKGEKIPAISAKQSTEILLSLRSEVNDYYSITANHFIHAGRSGFEHFHFLLSSLAMNVNLATLEELNTVWACILHKGHKKDKESDRSYRTISTCPLLAKSLDTYIGILYRAGWHEVQAKTQFQGSGSSHDLASLLLTETIQSSLHRAKQPVFVLLLDAKSAFDKVVHECAVRNAYLAGTTDQGLIYLDSRLRNRKTYIEWNKVLMGPIDDSIQTCKKDYFCPGT